MYSMDGKVFDRIEKKYLITKADKNELKKAIKKNMHRDNYHKSEVYNLYFDTKNYDLIIQSIDQPIFKHKLRARSYRGYDRVFLEIKTKLRGRDLNPGYKRRVMITHEEFNRLINGKTTLYELIKFSDKPKHDLQIAKEVDYLIEYYNLKPRILVIYNRESYKGENNLRITFDEKLKYRDQNLTLKKEKHDKIYFKDNRNIILEIKAHEILPLWLVSELSRLHLYPQQFSKIGKVYEKITKEHNVQ